MHIPKNLNSKFEKQWAPTQKIAFGIEISDKDQVLLHKQWARQRTARLTWDELLRRRVVVKVSSATGRRCLIFLRYRFKFSYSHCVLVV
ncbi:hypothetical protein GCK32_014645 [Trichostrongylus colubriformis]|uniref:Uncharacterized protein n=1 Tax=Trichostrongylus colubriformis TaxID=6319 RepID=A0AAN8FML0_TRICO